MVRLDGWTGVMDSLEARKAQWEQRQDDAKAKMDRARSWLDSHKDVRHPMRRSYIMIWNEQLDRHERATSEILRIRAAIKARDGLL